MTDMQVAAATEHVYGPGDILPAAAGRRYGFESRMEGCLRETPVRTPELHFRYQRATRHQANGLSRKNDRREDVFLSLLVLRLLLHSQSRNRSLKLPRFGKKDGIV